MNTNGIFDETKHEVDETRLVIAGYESSGIVYMIVYVYIFENNQVGSVS